MEDITDYAHAACKKACKDFSHKIFRRIPWLVCSKGWIIVSSCIWDILKIGLVMSQKLPVNKFKWIKDTFQYNEDFTKNYSEEIDEGYFFEVDIQNPEKLYDLHNDSPFLPERMKIEKVEKLVADWHDKTENVIYIRNLK